MILFILLAQTNGINCLAIGIGRWFLDIGYLPVWRSTKELVEIYDKDHISITLVAYSLLKVPHKEIKPSTKQTTIYRQRFLRTVTIFHDRMRSTHSQSFCEWQICKRAYRGPFLGFLSETFCQNPPSNIFSCLHSFNPCNIVVRNWKTNKPATLVSNRFLFSKETPKTVWAITLKILDRGRM